MQNSLGSCWHVMRGMKFHTKFSEDTEEVLGIRSLFNKVVNSRDRVIDINSCKIITLLCL